MWSNFVNVFVLFPIW